MKGFAWIDQLRVNPELFANPCLVCSSDHGQRKNRRRLFSGSHRYSKQYINTIKIIDSIQSARREGNKTLVRLKALPLLKVIQ